MSKFENIIKLSESVEEMNNFDFSEFSDCSTNTKVITIDDKEVDEFIEKNNCKFLLFKYFRKKSNMKNLLITSFSEENSKNEFVYMSYSLEDVKRDNEFNYKIKLESLFDFCQSTFDYMSNDLKRESQKVKYMLIVDVKKKLFTLTSSDSINCSLFELEQYCRS